jgi:hypothetical protein
VPPHIFEALARSPEPAERELALSVLSADTTLRTARTTAHLLQLITPPAAAAVTTPHKLRRIYTANHGTSLPGTVVRSEGQGPSGDAAVDEAYNGLGATFDLYWDIYQRNSIDDAGMDLIGTSHYGNNYDNAFFNGSQMVFGDGDGQFFNRFTIAVDVVGHELTHGVTAHTVGLVYHDQPGALNESMSDVFGSLVKQYSASPKQTAAQADWLIGAGLFTSNVNGVGLRSMKDPGTAYNDPKLGKDPQPADMAHYVNTTSDNGGVHINSGIPNRAFFLAAVALGGYAWEKAGHIWYRTLLDPRLPSTAEFQDFANLTADNADKLYGGQARQAVIDAWRQVGIIVGPSTISGNWVLHYSWGCTNAYGQTTLTFNSNGTFSGPYTGQWRQREGTLLLSFNSGPAKYAGTLDGNVATGAQSTFAGLSGCWYMTNQGITGLREGAVAPGAGVAQSYDVAGNPVGGGVRIGAQVADAAGTPV